jgi:mono/diheme cytochrome c family protein
MSGAASPTIELSSAMEPLAAALLAILVLISSATAADNQAALQRHGKALVLKYCARCHAIGRAGESPHRGAPPFRTLSQRYPIEGLEEALGEGIVSGHPHMPEFRFSADHIGAIIAYLKSIQER